MEVQHFLRMDVGWGGAACSEALDVSYRPFDERSPQPPNEERIALTAARALVTRGDG
jgi:hypothetical protein